MDFLKLFNGIVAKAKPVSAAESQATSMDDLLADLDIDSLDYMMISMYVGELYGIDEDIMKTMDVRTVQDILDFIVKHKTTEPESAEAGLEKIQ
jgi:acyl carrier protein